MNENTQLIELTQLPVIVERLETISPLIDQRVNDAVSLVCTEDNYKTVKSVRSSLNKEFSEIEEQRKKLKAAIMKSYDDFEAIYKPLIADKYKAADVALAAKVSGIEDEIKSRRAAEVEAYFNEHCDAVEIDFIPFERAGIKVGMSGSMKSLKEQCNTFIDRVAGEVAMIATQPFADEIMVEYKRSLNSANAITTVVDRHKAMEDEAARRAKAEAETAQFETAAERTEQFMPPVEADMPAPAPAPAPEEQLYKVTFTVTGTKKELIVLKHFLENGGYTYAE